MFSNILSDIGDKKTRILNTDSKNISILTLQKSLFLLLRIRILEFYSSYIRKMFL